MLIRMFNLLKKFVWEIDKKVFKGKSKRFYINNIENLYHRFYKKKSITMAILVNIKAIKILK